MTKLKFLLCAVIVLNVTCAFAQSNICKKDGDTTTCTNGTYDGPTISNTHVVIHNAIINAKVRAVFLTVDKKSTLNKGCDRNAHDVTVDSSTINGDCLATNLYLKGKDAKINGGTVTADMLYCSGGANRKQITGNVNITKCQPSCLIN